MLGHADWPSYYINPSSSTKENYSILQEGKETLTIGLDVDSKNQLRMLEKYFNSSKIGRTEIKETQHGYHIWIQKRAGIRQNIQTRLCLGDCKGRLEYDDIKIYFLKLPEWFDTLFEGKLTREGMKWHFEEDFNPLSLPFSSQFPAKKMGVRKRIHRKLVLN